MSDRELLELAAKEAGIEWRPECEYRVVGHGITGAPLMVKWNPLTDDGDALRLAVELGLQVTVVKGDKTFAEREQGFAFQDHGEDPCAATRRAIVRAAAALAQTREA
ncbi:hypothetical protein WK78_28985 [Burkholderia cepacia]|uniref:hypothetical protein n=1 Tax=Burkholderia cepacia TaxID=292 RepID=UPI00075CD842|nr:hypothetical protein [Burkholderia cepacia]KVV20323.1 hypothetical protein WK78_28985 [Burkholderia cepacia]